MCEINHQTTTFPTKASYGRDGNIQVTRYEKFDSCGHRRYGPTYLPCIKKIETLTPDGQLNTYLIRRNVVKVTAAFFATTALACALVACASPLAPLIHIAIVASGLAVSLLVGRELYFFSNYLKLSWEGAESRHIEHLIHIDQKAGKSTVLDEKTTTIAKPDQNTCVCGEHPKTWISETGMVWFDPSRPFPTLKTPL